MNISIKLSNDYELKLNPDTVIEWVKENTFFERDVKLSGQFTYPFSVSRKENSFALGFPDVVESGFEAKPSAAEIIYKGNLFYKGQINILDWDDLSIYISIGRNTKTINSDAYIDELGLPTYIDICEFTNRNAERTLGFPERDYCFPQFVNSNEEVIDKYGSEVESKKIVNWQNGNIEDALGTELVIPHFFLMSSIREIFKTFGYTLKSSLVSKAYYMKKAIFNTTVPESNADTYSSGIYKLSVREGGAYCQCMRFKSELIIPVGTVYKLRVVEWNDTSIVAQTDVTYTVSSGDVAGGTSQIMQSLKAAMNSAVANLQFFQERYSGGISSPYNGYGFNVQFTTGNKIALVNQSDSIGSPSQLWGNGNRREPWVNPYNDTQKELECVINIFSFLDVQMKNHLPHLTVTAFLDLLKTTFNWMITLDEVSQSILIEERQAAINQSTPKDMSEYLLQDDEGRIEVEDNWVIVFSHDKSNDPLAEQVVDRAKNYPEYNIAPVNEIGVEGGILFQESLRNSNSGLFTMPHTSIEFGNYQDKKDFALRFLHVYGYVADSAGKKSVFCDNLGLTPDELYDLHYKTWHQLMKRLNRESTFYFNFPFNELTMQQPTIWKCKHNIFAWKRITTYLHNNKDIQPSKVELYKI